MEIELLNATWKTDKKNLGNPLYVLYVHTYYGNERVRYGIIVDQSRVGYEKPRRSCDGNAYVQILGIQIDYLTKINMLYI